MIKILAKALSYLSTAKTIVDILVPVLETVIQKDLNKNGQIGK
jgi:hypothetical protein